MKGRFICKDVDLLVGAALRGRGLVCLPSDHLAPLVRDGRLVQMLEEWRPPFPGRRLSYPGRPQASPAFRLLLEVLRNRR